ncbi:MAG: lipoate--protein ligase family protein, partial [Thermoplasmatota archaeon]
MIFLDVPEMRWDETQLLYHTLGRMGVEALALTRTVEPYVCVGFSQSISGEVDEEYCGREGIGVFRRELGGGTVYIDREQLLIQLVLRRDSPGLPAGQVNFFKRFLSPLVEVYRKLGLEAVFRPTCDLLVNGRKISGTGGGEVGDCAVMATNVLIDFDYERMSRVLRCPSEEFRALLRKAMERGITSLRAELGRAPEWRKLRRMVREAFEALLGPMEETELGSGDGGAGGDTGVGGGRGDRDEGAAAGEGREGRARGRGAGG